MRPTRQDFDHFDADNAAALIAAYANVVWYWISAKGIGGALAQQLFHDFWAFVWSKRSQYDYKKGKVITWLSYKFKNFMTLEYRQKQYEDIETNWGLEPYISILGYDEDAYGADESTQEPERGELPMNTMPSGGFLLGDKEHWAKFWSEWFRTYVQSMPFQSNDFAHAAECRDSLKKIREHDALIVSQGKTYYEKHRERIKNNTTKARRNKARQALHEKAQAEGSGMEDIG